MNFIYWITVPVYTLLLTFILLFAILVVFKNLMKKESYKWINERFSEKTQKAIIFFGRVICLGFIVLIFSYSIPYWKDSSLLITGHCSYDEGSPTNFYHKSKDLNDYVELNGNHGKLISFLFTARMTPGVKYKVKYLPNTNTGIYIKKL
ncbi:hypothetical protein SAMN05216378_3331 [Paenibacillus catalpae]|uniref:Uncharacterized protein n=1 Tax=Paenibacillus catalpae TaxID=1045775 RepID=A0A1I2B3S8_9BACL|nr:hypothetical protein [Paenibacillus catalpae]SFE49820.1 hypothetical protein SAMN05216378_3331 [Paenibacillus catalpae]